MAHFAKLDANNIVETVIVVGNKDCLDPGGQESEAVGIAFCQSLFGEDTVWLQTSITSRIRKNYAATGYSYDAMRDAFIPPQPFPSWLLDESTCQWQPPIPMPDDGQLYQWDENSLSWVVIPPLTT